MTVKNKVLYLNKKTILRIVFWFSLFWGGIHDLLGLSGAIPYFIDFLLIFLVIIEIVKNESIKLNPFKIWFIITFSIIVFGYLINFQSLFLLINGLRKYFRYFLYFILCVQLLKDDDIDYFLKGIDWFFYLNTVVLLVQYFVFGYKQDYLGGLFGVEAGCNGPLNLLLVIIVTKSILFFLNKKESLKKLIFKIGLSVLIAALSELKFFYVEFLIIIIAVSLITEFSFKKLFIIAASILSIIIGINILNLIFNFGDFFTISYFLAASTGGESSGYGALGVDRLTFITVINSMFLRSNIQRLFGLGIGNCSGSSISIFSSSFYQKYSNLNYSFFATSNTYIEQGWLGLILLFSFFVIQIVMLLFVKSDSKGRKEFIQMGITLSGLSLIILVYNQSLIIDTCFFYYLFLALPFISIKNTKHLKIKFKM